MNKVFLNGYLAHDPESRITGKGLEFTSFSIGVSDLKKWDDTFFVHCTAFGTTAKYILNNLTKGQFVSIDGRIIGRSYINKEGKTAYTTDIVIDNIRGYGNAAKKEQSSVKSSNDKIEYVSTGEGVSINYPEQQKPIKERVHLEDAFATQETQNLIDENVADWEEL